MTQATYDDANLLLHLYELRREPKMREARAWFVASFKPKTVAELQALCPPGSDTNAQMRMVTSYWDMVASIVNRGLIDDAQATAQAADGHLVLGHGSFICHRRRAQSGAVLRQQP